MGQPLPHALQLFPSLARFTHPLLPQLVRPGGHAPTHDAAGWQHVWPPVRTCLVQLPQNCGSVFSFTHASPPFMGGHSFGVPVSQVTPQVLVVHVGVPVAAPEMGSAHTFAQAPPQLLVSSAKSTQPEAQRSGKPGASQVVPQLDIEQTGVPFVSVGQTFPHMPQLAMSEVVSTQTPLQSV